MELYYGGYEHGLMDEEIDEYLGVIKCDECGHKLRKVVAFEDDAYGSPFKNYTYECDFCDY